jgi:hypothetical protein
VPDLRYSTVRDRVRRDRLRWHAALQISEQQPVARWSHRLDTAILVEFYAAAVIIPVTLAAVAVRALLW